ncbi:hypothetical protein niasHT_003501 [Heterodera trifolii]|uniref:Uncharacterized protein n=1 Tax=Heterodera trifolii TaxID=157864 RepID=A0ABD2LY77_9BILA
MPDEKNSKDDLINWVIDIKALQTPDWIGLPNNAEKVLLAERGQEFIRKMIKMSNDELAYETKNSTPSSWTAFKEVQRKAGSISSAEAAFQEKRGRPKSTTPKIGEILKLHHNNDARYSISQIARMTGVSRRFKFKKKSFIHQL